jgi:phage terminase small subunit
LAAYIGLVFDLPIFGIPPHEVLFAAANPLRIRNAMQQEMAELVRQGEVDPPFRTDRVARSRRTGTTADRVVRELAALAFSNIFDFIEVQRDGSVLIDLSRASRDRAAAIHDVDVRRSREGSGNEGGSAKLIRIALCDKLRALEMLARHLGMYPSTERRSRYP